MTNVTIDGLNDGTNLQDSGARIIFNQNNVSYKGTIRPNPVHQINVINQAQLEAELGTDLIIPAGETVIISVDDSFTLNKPFKKQTGSTLKIQSQSINNSITYDGTGPMIRMDGAVIGLDTELKNITLIGNFSSRKPFEIEDSRLFIIDTVRLENWDCLGFLKGMTVLWRKTQLITSDSGIAFIDTPVVAIDTSVMNGQAAFNTTLMSFITTGRMDVVFENNQYVAGNNHEFLFLDPNSNINSSFKIRDSGVTPPITTNLFQQGTDIFVSAVADNGSGKLRCTAAGHSLLNDNYAVLSEFSESSYNATSRITGVSGSFFTAEDIDFVPGIDSGIVNGSSLDQTDPRVIAETNPDEPDSMSLAECRSQNPIAFDALIATLFPFQNTVPVNGDFVQDVATERFTVDSSTGVITYIGASPITSIISFEFNISKVGGGTDTCIIVLVQNALTLGKTMQTISLTSTTQKVIYGGGLFEINPGDTFQVFLQNNANSTINVDTLKVLVTRQ